MGLGIVLIIAVVAFLAYRMGFFEKFMNGKNEDENENAETILARRFASGEISREEFEEMKKTLEK